MANSFYNNTGLLDERTAKYVEGKSEENLRGILSGAEVYIVDGEGMGMVKGAMKDEGVSSYMGDRLPGGVGFGNSIYIEKSALSGELLGHEAVHILQTKAYGGLAGMFEAYSINMNALEIAAYKFGGYAPEMFREALKGIVPVFRTHPLKLKE